MAARHDILDRQESLQTPLLFSVGFHAAVFASMVIFALLPASEVIRWGDPNSLGGGAVAVTPVSKIPLPARSGQRNPLANDTESRVPAPPPTVKPERQQTQEQEEEAIEIPSRNAPPPKPRARRRRADPSQASVPRENQIYGSSGAAVTSDMFGSTSGGGGVGVGPGNPFGNRFGAYVGIIRQKLAQAWNTGQVDPRLQTAPTVIVTFDIMRDGSVKNVRFLQRSGHSTLDYSCQRAVLDASPFPPLPAGFERNSARIEIRFDLKR